MSEWCIRHKMETTQCADKHRIEFLEQQLAASEAMIEGAASTLVDVFDEKATLSEKVDILVRELTIVQVQLGQAKKLLRLPILFYAAGPVTDEMRREWEEATESEEMTTKVMCDAIRKALA